MSADQPVWVSITGLKLRRAVDAPVFWFHAIRCMVLARQSPDNLSADTRSLDGIHYTLSAWRTPSGMRAFVQTDLHVKAMTVFPRIATGKVLSFTAAALPDWSEVPELLVRSGRDV